jgi:hypothetical protein
LQSSRPGNDDKAFSAILIAQYDSIPQIDLSANQITADGIKTLQEVLT